MKVIKLQNFPIDPNKEGWPWQVAEEKQRQMAFDSRLNWPRITLVTPSYNQGKYIEETIRSALLQGYSNLEYIIMDGGSADQSVSVIKKYERWIYYWSSGKDRGQSDAIHKGFCKATGEILGWLNSDDVLEEGVLFKVAKVFMDDSRCQIVTGDGSFYSADLRKLEYKKISRAYSFEDLLKYHKGFYLAQPSTFFSRKLYFDVGGVSQGLTFAMDLDLWLKMLKKTGLNYIPENLSLMRHHEDAKTWAFNEKALREVLFVLKNHRQGGALWRIIKLELDFRFFLSGVFYVRAAESMRLGNIRESFCFVLKALESCPYGMFSRSFCLYLKAIIKKVFGKNPCVKKKRLGGD